MSLYNIIILLIGIVGAIVGIGSTLAIIVSLFGTLGYKFTEKLNMEFLYINNSKSCRVNRGSLTFQDFY